MPDADLTARFAAHQEAQKKLDLELAKHDIAAFEELVAYLESDAVAEVISQLQHLSKQMIAPNRVVVGEQLANMLIATKQNSVHHLEAMRKALGE